MMKEIEKWSNKNDDGIKKLLNKNANRLYKLESGVTQGLLK